MKRVSVLFILIMMLVSGCTHQEEAINYTDEDINNLKEEINSLIEKNTKLEDTLEEVTESIKSNVELIKELRTKNEELAGELSVLKRKHEYMDTWGDKIDRLNVFVKELLEYEQVLGYVTKYDDSKNVLFIDPCEWISMEETERINELGLDLDNDFPSGFYIYNDSEQEDMYEITERTLYYMLDPIMPKNTSKEEFINRLEHTNMLCTILIVDDRVIEVSEVYTP